MLDLTRVRSGPTAVRQFADWGADVVMVESPEPGVSSPRNSSDFQNLNRNKRSLCLDLKNPKGRAALFRLVRDADVLFENYRPDVKHRLGIDYAALSAINPRLVYVSISGFGQEGPYRMRPGLDQVIQGLGGLMSITGLPGQGPVRAGIAVADSSSGLYAALGALTALLEREVTGQGKWVRTSLLQAQIAMLDFQAARWLSDGEVPPQAGNDHPTSAPMGLFQAADGPLNLAVAGDGMFRSMCEVLGLPHLVADPRFARGARVANRAALSEELGRAFKTRTVAEWVEALNAAGVACGPVNSIDQVFADPQVQALGIALEVTAPEGAAHTLVGQPIEMETAGPRPRTAAPRRGEHSHAILREAGYSDDEIEALAAEAVI